MMTEEQMQRVKEVYETAAERDPAEWAALLDEACSGDRELRAEVEELLGFLPQSGDFIERPPLADASLFNSIAQRLAAGRRIGTYEVLEEIGRGGMGAVYLAVRADDEFNKQVAIKLVWPGFDSAEIVRRFKQERQILANLDHPNIARLLDGGTTEEGWPYVVMEYVDGAPITDYCNERQLPVAERLKLFGQVCEAVAYAHRNLVVHRDLKPGNIFVTRDGEVKLLDFGIAKILDPALRPDAMSLTRSGMYAMTPEYASPEQARNDNITAATDVYSLGVTLYELLTGVHPFRFKTRALHEMLRVICEDEPARPSLVCSTAFRRQDSETPPEGGTTNALSNARENTADRLRRRLQGDLDNIILKAIRKEPERRYASVEQLSEDIGRHLAGQPVIARRGSTVYRARKFIRRNKTAVAGVTILVLALLAGLIFAIRQARMAREEARENRRLAYPARLQKAQEAFAAGDYEQMEAALDEFAPKPGRTEEDLRGFEWRYLWRLIHRDLATFRHDNQVAYAEFFDQGRKLFTISDDESTRDNDGVAVRKDCVARSWDVETGRELRSFSLDHGRTPFAGHSLDDDGKIILRSEEDQAFKLWDFETGQLIVTITDGLARNQRIHVRGSSKLVARGSGDGTLSLLDMATGKLIAALRGHSVPIQDVELWPAKNCVMVRSNGVDLKLWDWDSKKCLATLRETGGIGFKLLAPNGRWLVTLVGDRTLRVRETTRFREIASHTETSGKILGVRMFNSSDRLVTVSMDGEMKIWRLPTLQQVAVVKAHDDLIGFLHYTPDEKTILTASNDRTAKLWDAATYRELGVARGHTGEIRGAIPSGDSRRIVTWGNDHTARVWDVATLIEPDKITGHTGWVFAVAFSPDGKRFATASQDGSAKIWEVKTGLLLATLRGHTQMVFCVAFSPDRRLIATAGEDKTARLWDAQTGRELHTLTGHQFQIHGLAFSPDGLTLATASDDRTVRLWDVATGREQRVIQAHPGEVFAVAFSPDGRLLATGGWDHTVKLWDVQSGQHLATFTGHTEPIWSLQFSPDGRRLASGSRDKTAIIWDAATGQRQLSLKGHFDEIFSVAFSPDGKRLATGSNDKTVRIWNAATGQELLTLKDHTDQVWSVAFSPDGRILASGSWDGTARLYRAASEEEVEAKLARQRR